MLIRIDFLHFPFTFSFEWEGLSDNRVGVLPNFQKARSLQNRSRDILRILGEQRRKRDEHSSPHVRFALRAPLAFAFVRLKYAKNYACSAG